MGCRFIDSRFTRSPCVSSHRRDIGFAHASLRDAI